LTFGSGKETFIVDRSKLPSNVYNKLWTFGRLNVEELKKLAYYLESEFRGCWISFAPFDIIISNKKVSEKELNEFVLKIRNLDDFKNLNNIMIIIDNIDNYFISTYYFTYFTYTLYDLRIVEEILFPGTIRDIEEILEKYAKKYADKIDNDFYLKIRVYFEVKKNELSISLESDIVYKGSVEDFYKRYKEKIYSVPVRDKYLPGIKGKIIDFIGKMKSYREKLINLTHPQKIERYKNIPDEEWVVLIKTYYDSELLYPISDLEIVKEDGFEKINLEQERIIEEIARVLARNGYIYEIQIMPGEIPDILKLDIKNVVFFDIEALKDKKFIYLYDRSYG
jgi:hypothetical protein